MNTNGKIKRRRTKETEKEQPVRKEQSQRVVCMGVKGNECLKKEGVVASFQCCRRAFRTKPKSDHWGWQLPRAVSVELFGQSLLTVGWRINKDETEVHSWLKDERG